jgi:hypothetical protein
MRRRQYGRDRVPAGLAGDREKQEVPEQHRGDAGHDCHVQCEQDRIRPRPRGTWQHRQARRGEDTGRDFEYRRGSGDWTGIRQGLAGKSG